MMILTPQSALFDWQYSIEYEIYPEFRHRYAEGVIHNTEHWFSVQVPEQLEVTLAPREHTAFLWLPHEEAASRCFSSSNADAISFGDGAEETGVTNNRLFR